jgi:hypothetical protein
MSTRIVSLVVAGLVTLATSGIAWAQNTTAVTAVRMPVESDWARSFFSTTVSQRWYFAGMIPGRSYCVSTSVDETTVDTSTNDTTVTVYSDQGTTQIAFNDDNSNEPVSGFYARNCFIWAPANNSDVAWIKIAPFGGSVPSTRYFRFKIYDTSLVSPWYFVNAATAYNSFIEIANTTRTTVSVRVTVRTPAGAVVGAPQTVNIAGNGNTGLSVAGFGVTSGSGSVQIAHNGAPGAVTANVTALSALEGLSFDAPATRRQGW